MGLIELIIVILIIAWLIGAFAIPVGGSLIHILIVVVLILVILRLFNSNRGRPL